MSTIVLAVYILGERLSSRRVLGGGVTLAGVLIVTADGLRLSDLNGSSRMLGNVLVMLAATAWSVFAVAQRRAQIGGGLFHRLTPIFSVATLVMLPAMLRREAWVVRGGVLPVVMFANLTIFGTNAVYWIYGRAQEWVEVCSLAVQV